MSTPVPQPSPPIAFRKSVRTRLQPIGGKGDSKYAAIGLVTVSILCAFLAQTIGNGRTIYVATNAPGATLAIDNGFPGTAGSVPRVPLGLRRLTVSQEDFETLATTARVGWFSKNAFSFQLIPRKTRLVVQSLPGAEVLMDGRVAGATDQRGVLQLKDLNAGIYDVQITSPGYTPFRERRHLPAPEASIFAQLNVSPERTREIEAERRQAEENRGKFEDFLRAAQRQFTARQYAEALSTVNEAIRLEPGEGRAVRLKNQIVQTMNILK